MSRALELLQAINVSDPSASINDLASRLDWIRARVSAWQRVLFAGGCIVNRGSYSSREMVVTETGRKVLAGEARPPRWADANGAPEAEKPRPKKRRRCLSCPRTFISEGPWNHVCPTCRESKEWRSPAAAAWACQEAT
jgi:predicted RNA-binding Zn-ribbon protein involved in translation (DUF1610 family)